MKRSIALALLLAALTSGAAHAVPVVLPEVAPIPTAKPAALAPAPAAAVTPSIAEPIAITTTPMPIPDSRLDVRVVGTRFLPPLNEQIDFRHAPAYEIEFVARSVARFLATAANRFMDDAVAEPPQQTAAVEAKRISVVIGAGIE